MSDGARFVVYEGVKRRSPIQAARVVAEDGHAFHVLDADLMKARNGFESLSFADAVAEAVRRAGRE